MHFLLRLVVVLSFVVVFISATGCAAGMRDRRTGVVLGDAGVDASLLDGASDARPAVDEGFVACETTLHDALAATLPADIIWVVDNSASMRDEESYVQTNVNRFSSLIAASGTDVHVIMISSTTRIVVPPPLGGSAQFLAVNHQVNSHDALSLIISTYPEWQSFLRADSIKHFVVVTDDESAMTSAEFRSQLATLTAPGIADDFYFHAIVAESLGYSLPPGPCFDKAEAIGTQYLDLQEYSRGVFASLCQTNWTPVFDRLAEAVYTSTSLPCTFAIPSPPVGEVLNPDQVNLAYTPGGGMQTFIPRVSDAANCTDRGGWFYDDATAPTRVVTCPSSCEALSSDMAGSISIAFGCATVLF